MQTDRFKSEIVLNSFCIFDSDDKNPFNNVHYYTDFIACKDPYIQTEINNYLLSISDDEIEYSFQYNEISDITNQATIQINAKFNINLLINI
jgi:hypothetical protein